MDPSKRFSTVEITDRLMHRDKVLLDKTGVLRVDKIVANDVVIPPERIEQRFPARIGPVYYELLRLWRGACNVGANDGWSLGGLANSTDGDMAAAIASVDCNVSGARSTVLHGHQSDVTGAGSLVVGAGVTCAAENAVVVRAGSAESPLRVDAPAENTCWIAGTGGVFLECSPETPEGPPPGFVRFVETEDGTLCVEYTSRQGTTNRYPLKFTQETEPESTPVPSDFQLPTEFPPSSPEEV